MKTLRLLAALPLLGCPGTAFATCPDCTYCRVDRADEIDFGTYSISDGADERLPVLIDLSCSQNGRRRGGTIKVAVGLEGHYMSPLGYPMHRVSGGPDRLFYDVFQDAGLHISFRGPGGKGFNYRVITVPATAVIWVGPGDFYALLRGGQNVPNGHYADQLDYMLEF